MRTFFFTCLLLWGTVLFSIITCALPPPPVPFDPSTAQITLAPPLGSEKQDSVGKALFFTISCTESGWLESIVLEIQDDALLRDSVIVLEDVFEMPLTVPLSFSSPGIRRLIATATYVDGTVRTDTLRYSVISYSSFEKNPNVLTVIAGPAWPSGIVKVGKEITLSVSATGSFGSPIQWYKRDRGNPDGAALPGKNGSSLTISSVQKGDSGSYYVIATSTHQNWLQRDTSNSVLVNVSYVVSVEAGRHRVIYKRNDGTYWGLGSCAYGEFDNDPNIMPSVNIPRQIESATNARIFSGRAMGTAVYIALDGTVRGTGINNHGQLGANDNQNRYAYQQVMGSLSNCLSISTNGSNTFVITTTNQLWGTGSNSLGDLGLGHTYDRWTPQLVMGGAKQVLAGDGITWVINLSNHLYACGAGIGGSLVSITDNVTAVSGKFILKGNQLYVFDPSERTVTLDRSDVAAIASHWGNALIITTEGRVFGKGENSQGELGIGVDGDAPDWTEIFIDGQPGKLSAIATYYYNSFFIGEDGTLWGCGVNSLGQLGETTFITSFIPVRLY